MMFSKKTTSIILTAAIIFSFNIFYSQKVQATEDVIDSADIVQNTISAIQNRLTTAATDGTLGHQILEYGEKIAKSGALVIIKIAALEAVRQATADLMGENGGLVITDYNEYLYANPRQQAIARMNSFFDTMTDGQASSSNYEGIGPNYKAYLANQGARVYREEKIKTTLQEQVANPNRLFDGGNMKGIAAYMECGNNIACVTLSSAQKYKDEFSKAQDLARSEDQGGIRPQKGANGRIIKPAMLAQNALLEVDDMGTALIIGAGEGDQTFDDAFWQISMGAGYSAASRALNYGVIDKYSNINVEANYPFSLGYKNLGS